MREASRLGTEGTVARGLGEQATSEAGRLREQARAGAGVSSLLGEQAAGAAAGEARDLGREATLGREASASAAVRSSGGRGVEEGIAAACTAGSWQAERRGAGGLRAKLLLGGISSRHRTLRLGLSGAGEARGLGAEEGRLLLLLAITLVALGRTAGVAKLLLLPLVWLHRGVRCPLRGGVVEVGEEGVEGRWGDGYE